MKRAKSKSFVAEFPLQTTPADEHSLSVRLLAARHLYNATLGESLRRLHSLRQRPDFALARALQKGAARTKRFQSLNERFGFLPGEIQKFAERCRDACWLTDHLGSHDTQTAAQRAFRAVQDYAFGKHGRPRFKGKGRYHSLEGKSNAACL